MGDTSPPPPAEQTGLLFEELVSELPNAAPYDETMGMLVSCHPLLLHRWAISRLKPVPAAQIRQWVGRYVTMVGLCVTGKTVQSKDGRPMEFVNFEDTTALFDETFFPKAYERF